MAVAAVATGSGRLRSDLADDWPDLPPRPPDLIPRAPGVLGFEVRRGGSRRWQVSGDLSPTVAASVAGVRRHVCVWLTDVCVCALDDARDPVYGGVHRL
jgi:hypothetical protein